MIPSVRGRQAFLALRASRKSGRSGPIRITYADTGINNPAVGFSVSRRVGNAVVRNRIRRRLRAVNHQLKEGFVPGAYLVVVMPEAADMSFDELKKHTETALEKLTVRIGDQTSGQS